MFTVPIVSQWDRKGASPSSVPGAYVAPNGKGARHAQLNAAMPAHKRQKGACGQAVPMVLPSQAQPATSGSLSAEVRFDNANTCRMAIQKMNGSNLGGNAISVVLDQRSQDQTRLVAMNLPQGVEWQEVKDHFSQAGTIAFVEVHGQKKHGPKLTGEIRYDTPEAALAAFQLLQGSAMEGGGQIQIQMDPASKDRTKLLISNLPAGTGWQDLKDHFNQTGAPVAYSGVNPPGGLIGEVRYDDPSHAMVAMQSLNGSMLCGSQIFVRADPFSQDGSKLIVSGIGANCAWQELKDHFATVGTVAFANTAPINGKGGGKGKMGKGIQMMTAGGGGNQYQGQGMGMGQQPMMVMMMPQGGKGKGRANMNMNMNAMGGVPMMLVPCDSAGYGNFGGNMMASPMQMGGGLTMFS